MRIGIAGIVESFCNGFCAQGASCSRRDDETVQVNIPIVGTVHVLAMNDVVNAREYLFGRRRSDAESTVRAHDRSVRKIIGV